jgi:hypothetical protein
MRELVLLSLALAREHAGDQLEHRVEVFGERDEPEVRTAGQPSFDCGLPDGREANSSPTRCHTRPRKPKVNSVVPTAIVWPSRRRASMTDACQVPKVARARPTNCRPDGVNRNGWPRPCLSTNSSPHICWKLRLSVSSCFCTLDCSRPSTRAARSAEPVSATSNRVRSWSNVVSSSPGPAPMNASVPDMLAAPIAGCAVDLANQDSINQLYQPPRQQWDSFELRPAQMALCQVDQPLRLGPARRVRSGRCRI